MGGERRPGRSYLFVFNVFLARAGLLGLSVFGMKILMLDISVIEKGKGQLKYEW